MSTLRIRISLAAKALLGWEPLRTPRTILPSDAVLVSYPKSGNTWLRFLVANVRDASNPADFSNIQQRIPDIYLSHDRTLLKLAPPRILKSHEPFDPRYRRVLYLVRDPRDVAVSYYHHQLKTHDIAEDTSLDDYVTDFLTGAVAPYGPWDEHVGSWLGARAGSDDFMMLRYEDVLEDTTDALAAVCRFLALDASPADLERAAQLSAFDRMRRSEAEARWHPQPTRSNLERPFVRVGRSGTWRDELSAESADRIEDAFGHRMAELGYVTGGAGKHSRPGGGE